MLNPIFWKKVQGQKHPGRWGIVGHQIPSIKVLFKINAKSHDNSWSSMKNRARLPAMSITMKSVIGYTIEERWQETLLVFTCWEDNSDIYGRVRKAATFVDEWGQRRYPGNVARNPKPQCSIVVTTIWWCNIQRKPPRPSGIMVSCTEAYAAFDENTRAQRQRGSNSLCQVSTDWPSIESING